QAVVRKYPLISGHSGFTELSLPRSETTDSEKLPSEATLNAKHIEMIRRLGGMVAPITVAKDLKSWGTSVPNDCAGSTKSWAQSYLYALDKMGGKAVALSTDYTLVVQSGPRFGFKACYENNYRQDQISRQADLSSAPHDPTPNGVRYDTPIQDLRD